MAMDPEEHGCCDRRSFIRRGALGAAAIALGGCTSSWKLPIEGNDAGRRIPAGVAGAPDLLTQVRGPGVRRDLEDAVARLLEPLGGMGAFVNRGQMVLLKPNMSFAVPSDRHATTSVPVVAAVARLARRAGAREVIVADHPVSDAAEVIAAMGIGQAELGSGVRVVPVTDESAWAERALPRGRSIREAQVLRALEEADVHIALPVAKSHGSAGFSGTLKGMMGLVRTRKTFHWLHDLHQAIVDLNTAIRPDLVIMDGLDVLSSGGPRGPGRVVRCDTLLAGTDPVAVDAAGVRLAPLHGQKVRPDRIRHLALAASMGLGRIDPGGENTRLIELAG